MASPGCSTSVAHSVPVNYYYYYANTSTGGRIPALLDSGMAITGNVTPNNSTVTRLWATAVNNRVNAQDDIIRPIVPIRVIKNETN